MTFLCIHGLSKSDDQYKDWLEGGVLFDIGTKYKNKLRKVIVIVILIKLCGRPHYQLNQSLINSNRYVCAMVYVICRGGVDIQLFVLREWQIVQTQFRCDRQSVQYINKYDKKKHIEQL